MTLIWRRPGLRVPQATHQDLAVDLQVQHQVMLIFIESMAKVEHEESSVWKGGSRPASRKSLALAAWDPLEEVKSNLDSNFSEGGCRVAECQIVYMEKTLNRLLPPLKLPNFSRFSHFFTRIYPRDPWHSGTLGKSSIVATSGNIWRHFMLKTTGWSICGWKMTAYMFWR